MIATQLGAMPIITQPQQTGAMPMQSAVIPGITPTTNGINMNEMMSLMITMMIVVMMMKMMAGAMTAAE